MKLRVLIVTAVLATACAHSGATGKAESGDSLEQAFGLTHDQANAVVDQIEKNIRAGEEGNPLTSPNTLDDVLEILREDRLDLFAHGVQFARHQTGAKAEALTAQLELAWGAAQLVAAEVCADFAGQAEEQLTEARQAAAFGGEDAPDEAMLAAMEEDVVNLRISAAAMVMTAQGHFKRGAQLASKMIQAKPDSYYGYRVLADFFLLARKWEPFGRMVTKVRAMKPDSNGLRFLDGRAAIERDGDLARGIEFLKAAVAEDPRFIRAQVALFHAQEDIEDWYPTFQAIRRESPKHQLVVLLSDPLDDMWKRHQAEKADEPPPAGEAKPGGEG